MSTPNDGGPAFPVGMQLAEMMAAARWPEQPQPYQIRAMSAGMSLRDYFAGEALAGFIAMHANPAAIGSPKQTEAAVMCYAYADAMIAERSTPSVELKLARSAVDEAHRLIDESGLIAPRDVSHDSLPERIRQLIALVNK